MSENEGSTPREDGPTIEDQREALIQDLRDIKDLGERAAILNPEDLPPIPNEEDVETNTSNIRNQARGPRR
jgi:hypothetical protein